MAETCECVLEECAYCAGGCLQSAVVRIRLMGVSYVMCAECADEQVKTPGVLVSLEVIKEAS